MTFYENSEKPLKEMILEIVEEVRKEFGEENIRLDEIQSDIGTGKLVFNYIPQKTIESIRINLIKETE